MFLGLFRALYSYDQLCYDFLFILNPWSNFIRPFCLFLSYFLVKSKAVVFWSFLIFSPQNTTHTNGSVKFTWRLGPKSNRQNTEILHKRETIRQFQVGKMSDQTFFRHPFSLETLMTNIANFSPVACKEHYVLFTSAFSVLIIVPSTWYRLNTWWKMGKFST